MGNDAIIGQVIIFIGFAAALVYLPLQIYAAVMWQGHWRWVALLPLLGMIPVIAWTVGGFLQESNLWPLLLIFASPFAVLYLVVFMVVHTVAVYQAKAS